MGAGTSFASALQSGIGAGVNMKLMKSLSAGHTKTGIDKDSGIKTSQSSQPEGPVQQADSGMSDMPMYDE